MYFTEQTESLIIGRKTGIGRAVADALSKTSGKVIIVGKSVRGRMILDEFYGFFLLFNRYLIAEK